MEERIEIPEEPEELPLPSVTFTLSQEVQEESVEKLEEELESLFKIAEARLAHRLCERVTVNNRDVVVCRWDVDSETTSTFINLAYKYYKLAYISSLAVDELEWCTGSSRADVVVFDDPVRLVGYGYSTNEIEVVYVFELAGVASGLMIRVAVVDGRVREICRASDYRNVYHTLLLTLNDLPYVHNT